MVSSSAAAAAAAASSNNAAKSSSGRNARPFSKACDHCHRRVPLAAAMACRCGKVLCSKHLRAEQHNCTVDYREMERLRIRELTRSFDKEREQKKGGLTRV